MKFASATKRNEPYGSVQVTAEASIVLQIRGSRTNLLPDFIFLNETEAEEFIDWVSQREET